MSAEIERKFLISKLPSLEGIKSVSYERYFLHNDNKSEIRVQKKGEKYELEKKVTNTDLSSEKTKIPLSQSEFETHKNNSKIAIIRDSYSISRNPNISIKIYHGNFEGLSRVEVEFTNEQEAQSYTPPTWFGKEITDSPLGRDSKLIKLSNEEFQKFINS